MSGQTIHIGGMWKQFKEFALRGNVADMAVGIIIGGAFTGLVQSLVKDIAMPPLSILTGGIDFTNKFLVLRAGKDGLATYTTLADAAKAGAVTWNYGVFATLALNFALVAFCVFLLVRGINRLRRQTTPVNPVLTKDQELLIEIRDLLRTSAPLRREERPN